MKKRKMLILTYCTQYYLEKIFICCTNYAILSSDSNFVIIDLFRNKTHAPMPTKVHAPSPQRIMIPIELEKSSF